MTPQVVLAAILSELADQVALGKWGDVDRCVVVISGEKSRAIVTYPIEPNPITVAELGAAIMWLGTEDPMTPQSMQ